MKITGTVIAAAFILVPALSILAVCAQADQNQHTVEAEQKALEASEKTRTPRPRMDFVRLADFHLKNGKLVFGKLVSENKNKITIEQRDRSRIIVSTYSKREVDNRTLHTKSMPEYKYYIELAEYFSGRTWDFVDDPDDFIQAIRCYEKAKNSIAQTRGDDSDEVRQINEKIEKLQADRHIWTREIQSRAELKKLELEATIETRIKALEDKVSEAVQQFDKKAEQLDKIAVDIEDNYVKTRDDISRIDKYLTRQLRIVEDRIEANRKLIDYIDRRRRYYYPYYLPRKSDPNKVK